MQYQLSTSIYRYQQVLLTFLTNKQLRQLIDIVPHSLTMLNATNTGFSSVEVWFTDLNRKQLQVEDNVKMTLLVE